MLCKQRDLDLVPAMYKRAASALHKIFTHPRFQPCLLSTPRTVHPALQNHGSVPRKDHNILYQTRIRPRWETAPSHCSTIPVPRTSCTPKQPQYDLLYRFFRSGIDLLAPPRYHRYRSLRTPRRTHPFHSLPHLPGSGVRPLLCTAQQCVL